MYELKLNFKPIQKKLDIYTRKQAQNALSGEYLSATKGQGLEFDSFREYCMNDDASRIDWKASMRAQKTLIREFREERNLEVVFVLDVSSSMCYGSTQESKSEYAAEVLAAISFAVLRAGDSIGLIMGSDRIVKQVPANQGSRQYYYLLKAISNPSNYEGKFDFEFFGRTIVSKLKKGTIVIFISDFIGLKEGWRSIIAMLSNKFEFISIMVRDPLDDNIPQGIGKAVISDPFSKHELLFDSEEIRTKYAEYNRNFIRDVNSTVVGHAGRFLYLNTSEPFLNKVNEFFKRKRTWR
jgi:uncharacterized protein (DUF58 family)